ncbi:hypothetical protein BGX21_000854 [Mortierella sp. AD011]|nr:hypothetical protein BGX21_000854 [Mortierella sp. AD011]
MLAIKEYDLCIMVPRHISQDYDELFILSGLPSTDNIPNRLRLLPRDTNYLIDVFFEHAHYYYPIINRAIVELHLMEPQTPQALFLLNIIFMTACMHLGRTSDIKRAIQFRERAKEVQFFIDDKTRTSRIQALTLGSMAIYGVFKVFVTFGELCGAHRALATAPSVSDEACGDFDEFPDLQEQNQSIQAKKGTIPEAAYQARLWTFWSIYVRDSIARLYFGWPLGTDSMAITSDLPKIEGQVGLGGNQSKIDLQSRMDEYRQTPLVIGKRRGPTFKRNFSKSEKRRMAHFSEDPSSSTAKASNRANYRDTTLSSDDEDDTEDEDESLSGNAFREEDGVADQDVDEGASVPLSFNPDGFQKGGSNITQGTNISQFSVLSPKILEQQSRHGYSQSLSFVAQPGDHHSGGLYPILQPFNQHELNTHMERMKILTDAEEDPTDGGSFARILFLEEVRLWTIGRRVGLYLAGRSSITAPSVCPAPSTKRSTHQATHETSGQPVAAETLPADQSLLGVQNTSQWSEEAWLQDHELQSLQAELIAWEGALPKHLKFRQDVDNVEVNQKVNGKMSTMIMSYYTITIMLQSSFLPIAQYNSSRKASSESSSTQPSDHGDPKQGDTEAAERTIPVPDTSSSNPITPTPIPAQMPAATSAGVTSSFQPQGQPTPQSENNPHGHVYFNTAHQICTELSNVILHHVELMLDNYSDWCSIQAKINHALTAALRVCCLNAKFCGNSNLMRDEAKAGFKMGSDLYKRLALLPYPLAIRSWPKEEDVQQMLEIEKEFMEMMLTQDEQQAALPHVSNSDETVAVADTTETDVSEAGVVSNSIITPVPNDDAAEQHIFGFIEESYKFDFDQPLIEL